MGCEVGCVVTTTVSGRVVGVGNVVAVGGVVGVVVGWAGVDVGVKVAIGSGVKVARRVGNAVGEGGSPWINRATPGMLVTAHMAAIPTAIKQATTSRLATMIKRFRVNLFPFSVRTRCRIGPIAGDSAR